MSASAYVPPVSADPPLTPSAEAVLPVTPAPGFALELLGYEAATRSLVLRDATGVYGEASPGGYGGPNTPRNAYALLVVAQRRDPAARVNLAPVPSVNVLTDAEFRLTPGRDGWIEVSLCARPAVDSALAPPPAPPLPLVADVPPGAAPALAPLSTQSAPTGVAYVPTGLFVYDAPRKALLQRYAYLEDDQTISVWRPATTPELLGTSVVVGTVNALVTAESNLTRSLLNERCILLDNDLVPDQFREPQGDAVRRTFERVRNYLEGATYQWEAGNRYQAAQYLDNIYGLEALQLLAA